MSDPEKDSQHHLSHSSLEDAATLHDSGKVPERIQRTDLEKETVIDLEKRPEKAVLRNSQASYLQDPEAQLQSPERRRSSVQSAPRAPRIVPRSQRRGGFARLVLIPEVEEPKDYSRSTKWLITFIISMAGVAAPFGSSIIFPSLGDIAQDFGVSAATTNFSIGCYMLSLGLFPLFWSSFCESVGRRPIYIISFALFVIWNVVAAISTNIGMFVAMRLLSGGASGSVQVVGAGTLADVWHVKERGRAMGFFYLGPLMGPLLSPIVGGLLEVRWGWRSTMWFLVVYGFLIFNLLFWCLPETLKSTRFVSREIAEQEHAKGGGRPPLVRTTTAQSVKLQSKIWMKLLKRLFFDPLKIVKYLRFPAVAITVFYASITFGSLYTLQTSVQVTFSKPPYNFSPLQIGLAFLGNSLGYLSASVIGGRWTDKIMAREAKRADRRDENGELIYQPEDRMRENAWIAAFLYPIALLWYGWTAEKGVHYVVPLIANFFFGVGTMIVFGMVTTMLTEFMPNKASTGVALNNLCRNTFSFIGAVVTEPLIATIGSGWLFTGVAVIAMASSSVIWAMRRFGPRWRKTMEAHLD